VTATELQAQLNRDPEWVAQRDAAERQRQERSERLRKAAEPLWEGLAAVGHPVHDTYLLKAPYPEALPVLLEHLEYAYPDRIREGVGRALGVRGAEFAWDRLVELFEATDESAEPQFKQGLGAALADLARKEHLPTLERLLSQPELGPCRIFFYRALTRLKAPNRWAIIEQGLGDEQLKVEAAHLLRERARREARQRRLPSCPPRDSGMNSARRTLDRS